MLSSSDVSVSWYAHRSKVFTCYKLKVLAILYYTQSNDALMVMLLECIVLLDMRVVIKPSTSVPSIKQM